MQADPIAKFATPSGYCKAAALAWLIYDYALTLDMEVEYIWRRRFSTISVLFFMTRYIPIFVVLASSVTNFLPDVSPATCDLFQWIEAGGTFVIIIVVQIVLQFRLYVMYGKSRRVLYANALLCIIELGVAGSVIAVFFPRTQPLPNSPLVFGSCFSWSPSEIAVILLAPLTYETYLALLAFRKSFTTSRATGIGKQHSLMTLLVRDNVAYFFLIAGTLIAVTLAWFFYPVTPGNSLITFTHVSGAIGGVRLIVNVRHAAVSRDSEGVGLEDEVSRPRSFHRTMGASFGNIRAPPTDWDAHINEEMEMDQLEDVLELVNGSLASLKEMKAEV